MKNKFFMIMCNNIVVRKIAHLLYIINRSPVFLNYSIKRKIFSGFLLVGLLPLICASVLQYIYGYKTNTQILEQAIIETMNQTDISVTNELNIALRDLGLLALNEDLINELDFDNYLSEKELINKIKSTQEILEYYSNTLNTLYEFPKHIILYVDWNTVSNADVFFNTSNISSVSQYEKAYGKKISDSLGWKGLHKLSNAVSLGSEYISYTSPFYNLDHKLIGYLEINIDMSTLISQINNISLTPNSTILLLDNKNSLITPLNDEEKLIAVNDVLNSYDSNEIDILKTEKFTSVVLPNELSGFKFLAVIPYKDITSHLNSSMQINLIILFVCFLMSLALALAISHSIYSPIKKLSSHMRNAHHNRFLSRPSTNQKDEISVLYTSFNQMQDKINELLTTVRDSELELKKAELNLLQSNINPHFLYNTLDTINWLAIINKQEKIALLTRSLSDIFRYSLNKGRQIISIDNEIKLIKDYVYIQTIRLGNKLNVSYDVDEQALKYKTLKIILQPLVENSIIHGMKNIKDKFEIIISVKKQDDFIVFEVSDNGCGADTNKLNDILKEPINSEGYGISNVNKRIKLYYGDDCGLFYSKYKTQGTNAKIIIKAKTEDN